MKKLFVMIFALAVMFICSIQVSAISGEGTEEKPYLVETNQDFLTAGFLSDKCYKLMNDINITDVIPEFSGVFDGNGYKISTSEEFIFNINKGTIKKLVINNDNCVNDNKENAIIKDCTISGGTLVENNYGTVETSNTTSTGDPNKYIVYNNYGIINNCKSSCNIAYINNSTATIKQSIAIDRRIADLNYGAIVYCSTSGEGSWAGIVIENYGQISNCSSTQDILYADYDNFGYISSYYKAGGIVIKNAEGAKIYNCFFDGDIRFQGKEVNQYNSAYVGGIAAQNLGSINACYTKGFINIRVDGGRYDELRVYTGGITGSGTGIISNSYSYMHISPYAHRHYLATISNGTCYAMGIGSASSISNCYFAGSLSASCYQNAGLSYNYGIGEASNIINSYYKSESPFSDDATHGTPLTATMLKLNNTFNDWDFDTVWGIDSEINDGYPYLQWQYEKAEPILLDYTINSINIKNLNDEELESIPETGSCYAEINIRKNTDRNENDYLIIAWYDENNVLLDFTYIKGLYNQNKEITLGTLLKVKDIKTIKAFVWDGIASMNPLSNICIYE